jgi:hypothetical protein
VNLHEKELSLSLADVDGLHMANGMYIYRLVSDNYSSKPNKLVYIK